MDDSLLSQYEESHEVEHQLDKDQDQEDDKIFDEWGEPRQVTMSGAVYE